MFVSLADLQDITRAGMMYVLSSMPDIEYRQAVDKTEMMLHLKQHPDSIVVLDYTLFDLNDIEELQVFSLRFPLVRWILFSVELSLDFVRQLIGSGTQYSILLKDSSLREVKECLTYALRGQRYICQHMTEQLLTPEVTAAKEEAKLTPTETENLKDIAMGMTTKEIAEKRFSSFHTVNTHRKNIFHKLGVNNVHEATRYALRSGLVDAAEYYI
jgi:DNA-binding NarL/FixJ family response regulator